MSENYSVADTVEQFVNRKVLGLQKSFLSGSPSSRAALARLRKLDQPGMGSWMTVGNDVFASLPELGTSRIDEEDALRAIKCAMKLFSIHQQSTSVGVAVIPSADDWSAGSFGRACYKISHQSDGDSQGEAGVLRRISMIESASDYEGIEVGLRALVSLMRGKNIQLNYGRLAKEIYFIQKQSARERVFMGWARDYYIPSSRGDEKVSE